MRSTCSRASSPKVHNHAFTVEHVEGAMPVTAMNHFTILTDDVDATVAFYRDVLGFELMAQLGPMAAFLARNGYHHHVGANTWESRGAQQAPAGTARLLSAGILLDDEADLARIADRAGAEVVEGSVAVHDPSGNRLLLTAGG
jgi:catechol 2,3-dioxygenase